MNNYSDILFRLRLKPKLGNEIEDADLTNPEYIDKLNTFMSGFASALTETNGTLDILTKGVEIFDDTLIQLQMGMGKVIRIQEEWDSGISSLVENVTWLEQRNKELNKTFSVSSEKAADYADTIRNIGLEIGFSDQTLFKFNKGLNDLTNGMLMSSKMTDISRQNLYAFQAFAQEQLGITEEAATGFEAYARTMGMSGAEAASSIQKLTNSLAATTADGGLDVGLDSLTMQKTIMEEIGNLTADIRLNYNRMGGSLEVAVLKAKALGFTMEQLDKVGENLLNIEQSVGQELEYQLLSGRRLTVEGGKSFTNEYRKAKLMGDATKQTELMADILAKEGKTLKTNFLARQKFAEMTGMGAEELSKALEKQAIAQELGVDNLMKLSGDKLTAKIAELRKEYSKDKDQGQAKIKKLDEFLKAGDTRTTHEKVTEDNLIAIAAGIKIIAGGSSRNMIVGGQGMQKKVKDVYGGYDKDTKTLKGIKTALTTDTQAKSMGTLAGYNESAKITRRVIDHVTSDYTKSTSSKLGQKLTNAKGFGGGKKGWESGGKKATDTVIYPDGSAPVTLDPKDTIYAMRPGDRFDKQLKRGHAEAFTAGERAAQQSLAGNRINSYSKSSDNSMSMVAAAIQKLASNNNSTPTLDVKALAAAIATAMQSVKVEAKIRTDDMYSSNRMNSRKNII